MSGGRPPADPAGGPTKADLRVEAALPIEAVLPDLCEALGSAGTAVLRAPPGAGKTTEVPLRLLDQPWLGKRRIMLLEPRRLAARAAARRMAARLGEAVGDTVGVVTRDERRVGPSTRIEVVTEGILTRRLQRSPDLDGVGLVILDEFHERNLQSDLGLAFLLDIRGALRPDLRLLVMSATLDVDRIALAVGGDGRPAPVVASDGRSHPVEIRYRPPPARVRPVEAVTQAVSASLRTDPGDILVFLAGAGDIRRVERALRSTVGPGVDVRPLFGALSSSDQDAALAASPSGRRRVVLSTDIAETSLTVDGVKVVVDTGEVRVPRYDPRTGMTRLRTTNASRASADQRTGRAGRTSPGIVYRLETAGDHARRAGHALPEILTTDLTGFALELALWGSDEHSLTFLDPPPAGALAAARELLVELGAIDRSGRVTPTGRSMAELPVHPRLGRMVVEGQAMGHGELACVVAALLDERDILPGRPGERSVDIVDRVRIVLDRDTGGVTVDRDTGGVTVDRDALATVRRRARELARRRRITRTPSEESASGPLVALAYPDRIAQGRGGGAFRLRHGAGVDVPDGDPLTNEEFIVVATVGPAGGPNRPGPQREVVHLAAAIDRADVERIGAGMIAETETLVWDPDRDDLRLTVERRLGAIVLSTTSGPPDGGPSTTAALIEHVRDVGIGTLRWSSAARALQARVAFAHRVAPDDWPDLSDEALGRDLDDWLAPSLVGATGHTDLQRIDVIATLRNLIGHHRLPRLDQLLPQTVALAGGRRISVDYDGDAPAIVVRAQDLFGTTVHPTLMDGRIPVVVHVLSPGRPIQVTADLPGFWAGSWIEVRKEMAGRYPKHSWPTDPAHASPPTRPGRGRRPGRRGQA